MMTPPPMPNMPEAKPATQPVAASLSSWLVRAPADSNVVASAKEAKRRSGGDEEDVSEAATSASAAFLLPTINPLSGTNGPTTIWNTAKARAICTALNHPVIFAPARAVSSAVHARLPAAMRSTAPALPKESIPDVPTLATAADEVPTA